MDNSSADSPQELRQCFHTIFYYGLCGHHTVLTICRQVPPDTEGQYQDTFNICTAACRFLHDMEIWTTKNCPWCARSEGSHLDAPIHPRLVRSDPERDHIPPSGRDVRLRTSALHYIDIQDFDSWMTTRRDIIWETYIRFSDASMRVFPIDYTNHIFFIGGPVPSSCAQRNLMRPIKQEELQAIPSDEVCAICRDNVLANFSTREASRLPCRHIFHEECVLPWIREHAQCPYCLGEFIVVDYLAFIPQPVIDRLLSIASQAPGLSAALSQSPSGGNT